MLVLVLVLLPRLRCEGPPMVCSTDLLPTGLWYTTVQGTRHKDQGTRGRAQGAL